MLQLVLVSSGLCLYKPQDFEEPWREWLSDEGCETEIGLSSEKSFKISNSMNTGPSIPAEAKD